MNPNLMNPEIAARLAHEKEQATRARLTAARDSESRTSRPAQSQARAARPFYLALFTWLFA